MSSTEPEISRDKQVQALVDLFLREHGHEFKVVDGKWWQLHPLLKIWGQPRARIRAGSLLTQVVGGLDPERYNWIYHSILTTNTKTRVLAYLSYELRGEGLPGLGWTPELAERYPQARF